MIDTKKSYPVSRPGRLRGRWVIAVIAIGLLFRPLNVVMAQATTPQPASAEKVQPVDASADFNQLITQLVLSSVPHSFTEDKDWGGQDERFDGFKRTRKRLRVEFETRKKLVNHGTWKKYQASLQNPEQEFSVEIHNLQEKENGQLEFDVDFGAHLDIQGRQSKWVKGVQLYSISAEGDAIVRLRLNVLLTVETDAGSFPPDLVFKPTIQSADIELDKFDIHRVSKAGGEFAQQVSRYIRPLLEAKVADKERGLATKLNQKIAKKQDRLRLSISEVLDSNWSSTQDLLPKVVKAMVRKSKPAKPATPAK